MEFLISYNGVARIIRGDFIICCNDYDLNILINSLQKADSKRSGGLIEIREPAVKPTEINEWEPG